MAQLAVRAGRMLIILNILVTLRMWIDKCGFCPRVRLIFPVIEIHFVY
jgi:hypothetical protein